MSNEKKVNYNAGQATLRTIIDANAVGDLSASGMNKRGLAQLPGEWKNTRDRETEGYELEIVGNIRKNWRVMLNGALPLAFQLNAFKENREWIAANDASLRQILNDAGVVIDSSDVARVDTSIPESERPDSVGAANAWNSLQNTVRSWVTDRQKITRQTRYTANFMTDYRFESGTLQGLRAGYGMQFRGPQLIGYRGAETIRNPANPNQAIDDPSFDAFSYVWSKGFYLATLTLNSPVTVYGKRIGLNLSVSNLFNYRQVQYTATAQRPPDGDVTNPARVTTPVGYILTTPRGFKLAAEYRF